MCICRAGLIVLVVAAAAGCKSEVPFTYNDAAPAVAALAQGMSTALTNGNAPADSAYAVPSSVDTAFDFSSYLDTPYTLNGGFTEVTATSVLNGTILFSGGPVSQIVLNNVVQSPPSGTYLITFSSNGAVYTYDLAAQTFILNGY
jgi:hypothetical protein